MGGGVTESERFGCEACCAEDASAARAHHQSYTGVRLETMIQDDSHFIVSVQRCGLCSQAFVSVFTEYVDWAGSRDAQYRTVLPITDTEADDLTAGRLSPHRAGALGHGRRHLQSDWPSSADEPSVYWSSGVFEVREGY
ncbi:hypothetical protein GCM10018790_65930 [Kitasatospora xanthocidica]|nr:hypothetical protein GCM10018790_65930 [Kitasatospora xanthocidica]